MIVLADKGYAGAGDHVRIPYRGRGKPASQKDANRAHAQLRSPGERANAQLIPEGAGRVKGEGVSGFVVITRWSAGRLGWPCGLGDPGAGGFPVPLRLPGLGERVAGVKD